MDQAIQTGLDDSEVPREKGLRMHPREKFEFLRGLLDHGVIGDALSSEIHVQMSIEDIVSRTDIAVHAVVYYQREGDGADGDGEQGEGDARLLDETLRDIGVCIHTISFSIRSFS